jgi:hypothetical protein
MWALSPWGERALLTQGSPLASAELMEDAVEGRRWGEVSAMAHALAPDPPALSELLERGGWSVPLLVALSGAYPRALRSECMFKVLPSAISRGDALLLAALARAAEEERFSAPSGLDMWLGDVLLEDEPPPARMRPPPARARALAAAHSALAREPK